MYERAVVVTFDDSLIAVAHPSGTVQTIRWVDVDLVIIETNDSGPSGADFWWILEGGAVRCAFPQGASGEQEAAKAIPARFPGFNFQAMIDACGSTDNAQFVCWTRPSDRTPN